MKSIWFVKLLLIFTLAAALFMSGCTPTNISLTGRIAGTGGNASFSMTHNAAATGPPQIIFSSPTGIDRLTSLSLTTTRQGAAPPLGYELSTVVNELSVGGGGGFVFGGPGVAGDESFHRKNTGKIAKVSYYWYESSGQSATFTLPTTDAFTPGNAWLARVRSGDEQALVPFSDTTSTSAIFLTPACLGPRDPCFDMATLAGSLFAAFSTAFTTFAASDPNIALGGPNGSGNFRLDYIPSVPVQMGPCAEQRTLPGFGFVFSGTLTGFLSSFEVSLPIIFAIDTIPGFDPRIKVFDSFVLPFDVVGSTCLESQGVGPIVVRSSTPLGVGASEAASAVRTTLACTLFGSTLTTINCPAGTPSAPATPLLAIRALGLMVNDTLNFYHQKAHGQSASVSPVANVYMRLRNADNRVTTTRMLPGTARDCPGALDRTGGRPPMCMVDLMVLE